MAKATHYGECQLCGNRQKLPADRLSIHGYTVQWGFFNGQCPGSRHLPLEVSCDLIEKARDGAKREEARLLDFANEVEAKADPAKAWINEYRAPSWNRRRSGYAWVQVPLTVDGYQVRYEHTETKRQERVETYGISGLGRAPTGLEVAAYLAKAKAKSLRAHAAKVAEYAEWLDKRLAAWAPRELTPV